MVLRHRLLQETGIFDMHTVGSPIKEVIREFSTIMHTYSSEEVLLYSTIYGEHGRARRGQLVTIYGVQ